MIWTQTFFGKAFDLLDPKPEMIDFAEVAETLARLNRYAGAAQKPVSVAQHTLIVFDACAPDDRPYALLHDNHEYVLGEIPTPSEQARVALAEREFGTEAAMIVKASGQRLKAHIDAAVWTAAGLAPPSDDCRKRLRKADIVALATERRDFLNRCPVPWAAEIEAVLPLKKVYRLRPCLDVADDLHSKFKTYLPALRRHSPPNDGRLSTPFAAA